MANGLPTPKSREQILSEMLTEYVGLTGVNDLNTGSVLTQFFDVVARSVARSSGDIFQVLRDYSIDRATGEALNRIGDEERIYRKTAKIATGTVTVTDTSFEKISTKIYAGSAAPNIGTKKIKVADASNFPSSGVVYIGRGTPNIEGPISYGASLPLTPPVQQGSYWIITLDSPTTKFHNISESVILGQKGVRNIPVNTIVKSPGSGATKDILYAVSSAAVLLDGENINEYVQIAAQEPGSSSNAPAGAIREFSGTPFTDASVINPLPLSNGFDDELDDDYRDRIKKQRLSRSLGTALAVKNSILNAQSSDENAIITSTEIDTTDPEQTILYLDNGQGYEEKSAGIGIEYIVDSAIGGEKTFQLATGGKQTSIAKAFLISSESAPFNIKPYDRLAILVGNLISEHIFGENDFKSPGAATAYEIVASINNNSQIGFEATTAEGGKKVLIQAKTEDNEYLQLSTPSLGDDAGAMLGFQKNEVRTVLLYKNRELLDKNGRYAFVVSKNQYDWSNEIKEGDTLIISVDGTSEITYTFTDQDFLNEGQYSTVNNQNSLSSWVNVINSKITGITAEINGQQLKLTSNLGSLNRASISINASSTLVSKGMFSSSLGLSAQGNEADFQLSRNTAQIKLNTPLSKGDSLQLGSQYTRAEIASQKNLSSQIVINGDAYLWLFVDSPVSSVSIDVTGDTFLSVSKPSSNIIRYTSSSSNAFANVKIGDYLIVWSNQLSQSNRLEGKIHAFTSNTVDLKITTTEWNNSISEGPVLFYEGFTIVRSENIPQKIKISSGSYDINVVASIMNGQLINAEVKVDNEETFIIRTNTENYEGSLFIADFNNPAKSLSFIKNSSSSSITSQIAYRESVISDKQFPLFIHGKITADVYADPLDSFINSINSSENLDNFEIDPSGFVCLSQPYGGINDSSTECIEIQNFSGSTITLENSYLYKRSRTNDRYHILNGFDFGHDESLVAILDNDPNEKTFNMPMYRTAITNITLPPNADQFRAYDMEGGSDLESGPVEFAEFFGNSFSFDNYKCLMQAKNIIDPGNPDGTMLATSEDAILYRSVEWGRSGEKIGIGYFYPTYSDQAISHVVDINDEINIRIFLKSGTSKDNATGIDGTTEWNVTIIPFSPTLELVTYSYSGVGSAPNLSSIISGDYVSIIDTGEFDNKNLGSYKVYVSTSDSFTIKRPVGIAVAQSNVATLQNNTISFFQSTSTTASDIVTYVTNNLSNFITASLVDDNGLTGSGIISISTEEDLNYTKKYIKLVDGKNYILNSNLAASAGLPQFTFKKPLTMEVFYTNVLAYSFNNGETIKLIPITANQISSFLNVLAVTGFSTLGKIKSIEKNSKIQLSTDIIGSDGAIQVAGGTANYSAALVQGGCSVVGNQENQKCIITIDAASAPGFHSDQWVELSASDKQRKITGVDFSNSIQITQSTPSESYSKIKLFDRTTEQRLFGRNRYHTRTRGKTFKIEKQGKFACISWDEIGTEPYFSKQIDIKDSSLSTITIYKNEITNAVDLNVDTGDMRFDEVAIGDMINISNRLNDSNNGVFKVIGKSNDGKTIRIYNVDAVNELAYGSFTITNNLLISGNTFTVGSSTITEGIDFFAGITDSDTASNLAAAISLISNIVATSTSNVVNIESSIPNVSIVLNFTGSGVIKSANYLTAPDANSGDLIVKSEIQEGDSVIISNDFNVLNKDTFRIIRKFKNSFYIYNPNAIEEEITLSDHFLSLNSNASTNYNIQKIDSINRLSWAGLGDKPSLDQARPGDILILGSDFSTPGEFHIVASGDGFVDFINVNGVDQSNVIISDVLQIHTESIKFKEYEGTIPGDTFVITNSFLGDSNKKSFVVYDVLNENEIIVIGTSVSTSKILLESNFNKIYLEEKTPYTGYKKISLICTSPDNLDSKNIVFDTSNQFEKIGEIGGVSLSAIGKLEFLTTINKGIDSYRYNTGLIGEANRIVYGDPRDHTTYPGVAAAGAEIFIKAPLVKRIEVSINVRIKTGISFTTIIEEIRSSVSSLINSNPVGQSIPISNIVNVTGAIMGVQAVAISSPQYDAQNDIIRINAGEKSLILDAISDIIVSKIE